jgi:hypothetical protein
MQNVIEHVQAEAQRIRAGAKVEKDRAIAGEWLAKARAFERAAEILKFAAGISKENPLAPKCGCGERATTRDIHGNASCETCADGIAASA